MSQPLTLARPYARAAFGLANEQHALGDWAGKLAFAAQVASGKTCGERLAALCERQRLDDLEELSEEIISRSEASTRDAIRKLPAGTWHGESKFDVPGGEVKLGSAVPDKVSDAEIERRKKWLKEEGK